MLRPLCHLAFDAPDARRPDPAAASMPVRVSRRALALLEALCVLRASPRRRRWTGTVALLCQQAMLTHEELDEAAYELALRGLVYSAERGSGHRYWSWRPCRVGATVIADSGHECAWSLGFDVGGVRRRWDNTSRGAWDPGTNIATDTSHGYWLSLTLKSNSPRRTLVVNCGPTGVSRLRLEVELAPNFNAEADAIRLGRLWSCELPALGRLVSMPRCV